MIIRRILSRLYRQPEPGDDGGGYESPDVDTTPDTGEQLDTAPVDAGDAVKPTSMHEAMFPPTTPEQQEAAAQRARDEKGRFANKLPVDPNAPPVDPIKKPAVDPKDLTVMPEGLAPKAQERFQALANTNKELAAQVDQYRPMVESAQAIQQTFQQNGVTREQFEQATGIIGLLNSGKLEEAQRLLEDQLRHISLATGKPIGQVDSLAGFPDLRERVDSLQLAEQDAIALARQRTVERGQQQGMQRQQQEHMAQQQEQQAIRSGQETVDQFCKERMRTDLDYARIEPLVLKQVQEGLLQGIPPSRWAAIVEKTYNLIKQTTASARQGQSTQVLRPTGVASPSKAPGNAFEAMWGKSAPSGM